MRLSDSAAIEMRPTSSVLRNWLEPHRGIADEVVVGHPHVVEEQLARVEAAPADAAHLRAHREARACPSRRRSSRTSAAPPSPVSVRASSVTPNDMSVPALEMNVLRPLISQPPSRRSARGADAAGVGAGVGLGEPERAERASLGERSQPALALRVVAEQVAAAATRSSRAPATPPPPTGRPGRAAPSRRRSRPSTCRCRPTPRGSACRAGPSAPISRSRSVGQTASSHACGARAAISFCANSAQVDQVALGLGEREVHRRDPIGPTGTNDRCGVASTGRAVGRSSSANAHAGRSGRRSSRPTSTAGNPSISCRRRTPTAA